VIRAIEVQVSKIQLIRDRTILKRIALGADDADAITKAFRDMSFVLQTFQVSDSFHRYVGMILIYLKLDTAVGTEAAVNQILKVLCL
jgi:hypothetical protein